MVATLQGHRDAVKDPKHRAKLWARPATSEEPQQVDALLTWVENLWRELKIKEEDRHLFLEANNLPSRNLVDRLQRTVYAELVSSETPKRPKSALDCWYAAQNEHFSFVPTEKVDKEDDEMSFGLTAAPYRGTAFSEEEDLSPMKVYGPGRIYAETSYRLLRGSTDASDENKEELIELLKTTKRQPTFGGKIEEAAAGPAKRMPGSRASRD